jgi:penicillin amidase
LWSDGKRARALRWVGAEPGTAGYLASLSVDQAQNWTQYLAAMRRWKVPPENLVYADVDGNIGEQSAGLAPIRMWSGLLPVPGAQGKYEWSGFVPLDQLPRQFNPKTGFYATANNKVINDDYRFRIGYSWSAPYRVDRINQVLGETSKQRKLTVQDSAALQSDVTSLAAKQFLAVFHSAAFAERAELNPPVELLWTWNATLSRDSAAGAIYEALQRKLRPAVAQLLVRLPDNPALQSRVAAQFPFTRMLDALSHPDESTFGSNPVEKRNQLIRTSLYDALVNTGVKDPAEERSWQWGQMHTITFRHSLATQLPFANLGPIPRPGDGTTVNATSGTGFTQTSGASYREIFDLSNWDNSLVVNTPGQSGQPLSPHYSDLLPLWDAGQYFPLAYSREAVEKVTTDKLILQP